MPEQRLADVRAELEKALTEAEQLKASAQKSAELLAEEQKTREAAQARVADVEGDLSAIVTKRDALKVAQGKDAAELKRLDRERQEAASRVDAAKEELWQAMEIASGAFSDLPRSVEEVCHYFGACADPVEQQKSLWLQFQDLARPQVFGDKLK